MGQETDAELREDVALLMGRLVHAAFQRRDEIWLLVDEVCEEAVEPDAMREFAAVELERLWTTQRRVEAEWTDRTDCDRLDQAFAELESTGIVCRQDFTCCGSCGVAEMALACGDLERAGQNLRGYAFYHAQDTEHAVAGDGLYLNYGDLDGDESASLAVGREVVAVLQSHGLTPSWDERWASRIHVPLSWRRRLHCASEETRGDDD
jgi:hypothetical protein